MLNEAQARAALVAAGRMVQARGWTPARAGNLSLLLDDGWIVATPAGARKGQLDSADLVVVDRAGQPRDPAALLPSTELQMHLAVYAVRPDVRACVHCHQPLAIACSVAGLSLEPAVLPEIILTLGRIPTVPYAQTGTAALAEAISPLAAHHDALILDHHGSLALGATLEDALCNLELIEHAAEIFLAAHSLGAIRRLPRAASDALLELRRSRGGDPASEPPR